MLALQVFVSFPLIDFNWLNCLMEISSHMLQRPQNCEGFGFSSFYKLNYSLRNPWNASCNTTSRLRRCQRQGKTKHRLRENENRRLQRKSLFQVLFMTSQSTSRVKRFSFMFKKLLQRQKISLHIAREKETKWKIITDIMPHASLLYIFSSVNFS